MAKRKEAMENKLSFTKVERIHLKPPYNVAQQTQIKTCICLEIRVIFMKRKKFTSVNCGIQ